MGDLTHYKKLRDPNYFGAYEMIYGENDKGQALWREMTLTIVKVVREKVKTQKSDEQMVVYFMEAKPMILNAINSKNMAKACGSEMIENWAGKKVTAYVEYIHSKLTKEWVYASRIRPESPVKILPVLIPSSEKWADARKSILAKNCTIEQIRKKYQLSNEHEELLTKPE